MHWKRDDVRVMISHARKQLPIKNAQLTTSWCETSRPGGPASQFLRCGYIRCYNNNILYQRAEQVSIIVYIVYNEHVHNSDTVVF